MLAKLRVQEIQAFSRYKAADGTDGVSNVTGGMTFRNGLYCGGNLSGASAATATPSVTIIGTAGAGYIEFAAQTSNPAVAAVHIFSDSGGHFAIGQSGSSGKIISFTNGLLTAHRNYAFQDRAGTLAMTGDNLSTFTNDTRFVTGPAFSVNNRIASFDLATGLVVKDSGILTTDLVLNTRTLTEGAGLAGNTYDLSANRTLAMGTPSTLTVATTNSASGTTHSHAITSSANPGAAAAILATDSSGFLRLVRLGIAVAPTQPLHVAGNAFIDASTANLYMKDTSTGFQAASTLIVTPQSGNSFRTTSFTSGLLGWNVSNDGSAEFNNVTVRGELRSSVFKVNEIAATAGTLGVFYSASTLTIGTITASGGPGFAFNFNAKNSDTGGMLFGVGDIVRLKAWNGSSVADVWGTITSRTNNGTNTDYVTLQNSGSGSVTFPAGTAVVDYGPSGTGFITLSTDGTVGSSPNLTMATHAGSPWSAFTTLLRLGNLNGSYGYATDVYGLGIGQYGTASKSWQTIDQTNGYRIGNNTAVLVQFDVSGNATFGQVASSKANAYWNASNSRLEFRGSTSGTVVQSYIGIDGSFVAGGGSVTLNANGLSLNSGVTSQDAYLQWLESGHLSGYVVNQSAASSVDTYINSTMTSGVATTGLARLRLDAINNTGVLVRIETTINGSTAGSAHSGYINMNLFQDGSLHGTFAGLAIGSSAAPTHMLDVFGTGWFQSTLQAAGRFEVGGTGDGTSNAWIHAATNRNLRVYNGTNGLVIECINDALNAAAPLIFAAANYGFNNPSFGANAVNVFAIGNGTAPTTSPAGIGQLWVESGALKYRGSSGTVTTIAVA